MTNIAESNKRWDNKIDIAQNFFISLIRKYSFILEKEIYYCWNHFTFILCCITEYWLLYNHIQDIVKFLFSIWNWQYSSNFEGKNNFAMTLKPADHKREKLRLKWTVLILNNKMQRTLVKFIPLTHTFVNGGDLYRLYWLEN